MTPLNIALTKGRLEQNTIALLQRAGIDCTPIINKGRKLIVDLDGKYNIVFAKAQDVITYVEHGAADVGIVGKDTIMEAGRPIHEVLDLKFGNCRFCIAAKKERELYNGTSNLTIATKYPVITKRYFEDKLMDVSIVKIEGSVELAPLLNLSDAIADLVETGKTLEENGLEVKETVCQISARLIVNTASLRFKRKEIDKLISILSIGGQND